VSAINRTLTFSLVAVLMLVIVMRFYGILQGLPFSDVTDEVGGVAGTLLLASQKTLKPNPDGGYTSMYNNFLAVAYGVIFVVGKISGKFHDKFDFALQYMTNPWLFYFTARFLSFISGVGAIWYTWKSGRLLTDSQLGGILSAVILGLSVVHLQMSSVGKVDAFMVFFTAGYIYHVVKIMKGDLSIRNTVIAGIMFGFAVASKMNAALLVPALPVALLIQHGISLTLKDISRLAKLVIIFGAVSFLFFLIGNPQFLINPKVTLELMTLQTKSNTYVVFSEGGTPTRWLWVFHDLIWHEGAVGILFILSMIYAVYLIVANKRYELIMPLVFVTGYIAYIGNWTRASLHYLIPVYPLFTLLSASVLQSFLVDKENTSVYLKKATGIVAITLVVVFGFWKDARAIILKSRESTRIAAKIWMENNIPKGTMVAYDDYAAAPPFFSPDVYLNPGTKTRFGKFVPEPLKEKLLAYADKNISYKSMRLRYYLEEPLFPESWTPEFRKANEKDPNVIHYYRVYFDSPEDLYEKSVEYIVVSYGYYGQFYTVQYTADNPLYEFNERGLKFYKRLFGSNRYYTRVAEFKPSKKLTGATITVFKKNRQ